MQPKTPKLLEDIRDAGTFVLGSIAGRTLEEFSDDRLLRQAVERNFEIIGEALNRLKKDAPDDLAQIREYSQIIAFRNVLSHGYDIIEPEIVWRIVQDKLPLLLADVENLLAETERDT